MRRAWLTLAASVLACGGGGPSRGPPYNGGPLDFTVGGMSFHIASGATVIAGGVVTLSLSDQADTCATLINAKRGNPPVGTWTVLSLNAAPGVDGSTTAQVIATNTPTPSPGKVAGALRRSEGNTQLASLNAADGTVSWTLDATNDSTITLDVGFAGTPDRINTYGIFLNQCQP